MMELLKHVESHARTVAAFGCEEVRVGPFTTFFHEDPALCLAIPHDDVASFELTAQVAALRDAFADRGLKARVELAGLLWPTLTSGLERHGFVLDAASPIVVATPQLLRPRRGDLSLVVRRVGERDDLVFLASLIRQGFEIHEGPATPDDVAALKTAISAGVVWVTGKLDGAPAGSGCSTPVGETTEISSLSVLPAMRRKGAAAGMITFMAEEHFATGGTIAWASPPAEGVASDLFASLGFVDAGLRMA
jgi:hypothetical protein